MYSSLETREINSSLDKKKRTILTRHQTDTLKSYFIKDPYPNSDDIDMIASELDLDSKKVANWFTHQRQQNKSIIASKK